MQNPPFWTKEEQTELEAELIEQGMPAHRAMHYAEYLLESASIERRKQVKRIAGSDRSSKSSIERRKKCVLCSKSLIVRPEKCALLHFAKKQPGS